ncbi:hypothetical protein J8Z71_16465 [Acinetobacter nosocomialis]|uniref:hypothetical protein n=1 Tax=Acinetobacter nosocomialis TaxID=106654 RepID=UPI001AE2A9F2|nr:hypothetical protein [Acinetobacter nosocomialis]MBP1488902.1 hypothetical protein [Acinetobacter nosocomialis]
MLFSSFEVDKLNLFQNTANILNTLDIIFSRFEISLHDRRDPDKNIDFNVNDYLQAYKDFLIKLETVISSRNYPLQGFVGEVHNFNKGLLSVFNFYDGSNLGNNNNINFVSQILPRLRNFIIQIGDFFYKNYSFELKDHFLEIEYLTEDLFRFGGGNIDIILKPKDFDCKIIYEDFLILKKDFLNFKDQCHVLFLNNDNKFFEEQENRLRSRVDSLTSDLNEYTLHFKNKYNTTINNDLNDLSKKIKDHLKEMNDLAIDVNLYKSIVSKETENEISKYYSEKAKDEKKTYWWATSASIIIISVAIIAAWFGLDNYYNNYVSVSICQKVTEYKPCMDKLFAVREASKTYALFYLIMRLVFSLLLFLTVIYTSRIAIRAYSHWRHSENMHLKLASLRPFINQLSKEECAQIYKDLVPDYFGKDAGLVENVSEKFKDLPANVSAVAMKAIEQISGSGSNSSTEKNNKKPESETG